MNRSSRLRLVPLAAALVTAGLLLPVAGTSASAHEVVPAPVETSPPPADTVAPTFTVAPAAVAVDGALTVTFSEAVTGVIELDNTLIVCAAFGSLPADVRVVEVEPEDEGWGEGFSDTVAAVLDEVLETVWSFTRP